MSKRLSLTVALQLVKGEFVRGIREAQVAVERMRMRFLSMGTALVGGGLSLGSLAKRMQEVARATMRSEVMLKNVSKSQLDYAKSLRMVRKLAKEYGQSVIDLTESYSKMRSLETKQAWR